LEVVRLHYFNSDEIEELVSLMAGLPSSPAGTRSVEKEPGAPAAQQGVASDRRPDRAPTAHRADPAPKAQGRGLSNPDF
jgi:hypothetical protein